jgi:hypothetical protein
MAIRCSKKEMFCKISSANPSLAELGNFWATNEANILTPICESVACTVPAFYFGYIIIFPLLSLALYHTRSKISMQLGKMLLIKRGLSSIRSRSKNTKWATVPSKLRYECDLIERTISTTSGNISISAHMLSYAILS